VFLDDAVGLAHQAAKTCALALVLLGQRLNLPADTATQLAGDANLIATVLAPQLEVTGTLAKIGSLVASDAIAVGDAMSGSTGARDRTPVFYDVAMYLTTGLPPTTSPAMALAAGLGRMLLAIGEAAFLGQAFLAEAQSDFSDRQSAIDARGRITAAMDDASDRIANFAGADVFGILAEAARQASAFIVAQASQLRPVVQVDAARSFPSTALAWSLYGDPSRAQELVDRNRVGTSLFMPASFEALSPDLS
jgi:hypothetical protein